MNLGCNTDQRATYEGCPEKSRHCQCNKNGDTAVCLPDSPCIVPGNIDPHREAKIHLLAARSSEIHSWPALSSRCRKQIEKQYTKILTKVVFFLYTNLYSDQITWSVLCNRKIQCWGLPGEGERGGAGWLRWCVEGPGCVSSKDYNSPGVVRRRASFLILHLREFIPRGETNVLSSVCTALLPKATGCFEAG